MQVGKQIGEAVEVTLDSFRYAAASIIAPRELGRFILKSPQSALQSFGVLLVLSCIVQLLLARVGMLPAESDSSVKLLSHLPLLVVFGALDVILRGIVIHLLASALGGRGGTVHSIAAVGFASAVTNIVGAVVAIPGAVAESDEMILAARIGVGLIAWVPITITLCEVHELRWYKALGSTVVAGLLFGVLSSWVLSLQRDASGTSLMPFAVIEPQQVEISDCLDESFGFLRSDPSGLVLFDSFGHMEFSDKSCRSWLSGAASVGELEAVNKTAVACLEKVKPRFYTTRSHHQAATRITSLVGAYVAQRKKLGLAMNYFDGIVLLKSEVAVRKAVVRYLPKYGVYLITASGVQARDAAPRAAAAAEGTSDQKSVPRRDDESKVVRSKKSVRPEPMISSPH